MKFWIIWCLKTLSGHSNTHLSPIFGKAEAGGSLVQGQPGQVVRPCLQKQTCLCLVWQSLCTSVYCVWGPPLPPLPSARFSRANAILWAPRITEIITDTASPLFLNVQTFCNDLNQFFFNAVRICRIISNVASWLSKIYFAVAFVFGRLKTRRIWCRKCTSHVRPVLPVSFTDLSVSSPLVSPPE